LIPLQLKLPITTQGVGYQSVVNAYLRSLGREIIQEVALALNIDEERLSIDPVLDESHLAAPLSSFIDGATIQMELYLHPPLLMKPTDDENKVGTTQEMSEFSSLVLQGKWCNDVQWWFSMAHAHHDHQVTHVVVLLLFCCCFVAALCCSSLPHSIANTDQCCSNSIPCPVSRGRPLLLFAHVAGRSFFVTSSFLGHSDVHDEIVRHDRQPNRHTEQFSAKQQPRRHSNNTK